MENTKLDKFTNGYIEAAIWSSTDSNDVPLDKDHSISDLAPDTLVQMKQNCYDFQADNAELLANWYSDAGEIESRAGHDFWLTRNRHGAGYGDRHTDGGALEALGKKLTEAAHGYGESDLYIGDDELIHVS